MTLVNVTLPQLLTLPPKLTGWLQSVGAFVLVTAMQGLVVTRHTAVALAETGAPPQMLAPCAVSVLVREQTSFGTTSVPVKVLHSPLVSKG